VTGVEKASLLLLSARLISSIVSCISVESLPSCFQERYSPVDDKVERCFDDVRAEQLGRRLESSVDGQQFAQFCSEHCRALIEFLMSSRLLWRVWIVSVSFLIEVLLASEGVRVEEDDAPSCEASSSIS
jgi:hypothetical protein